MSPLTNASQYSVTFINQSPQPNSGDFALFIGPDPNAHFATSVVWMSKFVNSGIGHLVKLIWKTDYCFVWGTSGALQPGVIFSPEQILPTDLINRNQVSLTFTNGAFNFVNQRQGPQQGVFLIREDQTIPMDQGSVGIGMNNRASMIVEARPNMNIQFTPRTEYWCAFGNYKEGQVVEWDSVTNKASIQFDHLINDLYAILTKEKTWIITSKKLVDQRLVAAQQLNASITLEELDFSSPDLA